MSDFGCKITAFLAHMQIKSLNLLRMCNFCCTFAIDLHSVRFIRGAKAENIPVELEQIILLKEMKTFHHLDMYHLAIFFAIGTFAAQVSAQENAQDSAQVLPSDTLGVNDFRIEEIEVTAKRVEQTTLSTAVIRKEDLNRDNTGQNLPYLLSTTPGLMVTSDDGLGVGYTYFRIRGTDHTRINMTVNDVPLNDGESQGVFWVNMTDMSSSLSQVEVQRGVGTSTNGSASFGASLNMRTDGGEMDRSRFTIAFNGGMYNTFREMADAHVVLPGRWVANARFSKVNSDGFLYHSTSDLLSYYGDFGWYGRKTQVVARLFGGKERTAQAWEGVDYETAYGINGADRRTNPADSLNWDSYAQQHAQIAVTHRFTPQWSLNATLHYTHGKGNYEQYKKKKYSYWGLGDSGKSYGFYQKWLDNHFAGAVLSAKYISEAVDAQFGAAANDYIGAHWGILDYLETPSATPLPFHYEYYRNRSNKIDANAYAKVNWRVINRAQEKLSLYADLQYRFIRYMMRGMSDDSMMDLPFDKDFHFFNPKAGLTYQNRGHLLSGSFAIANREPSRANYTENIYYDAATKSYIGKMPEAERLYDYELGYQYAHPRFNIGLNLYFMDYDNQLVLTGKVNDVGNQSTTNVKDSYRMGMEFTTGVKFTRWFRWEGNIVLSRNKIRNYTETITRYDENWEWVGEEEVFFKETTIAFSPSVTAMSLFTFDIAGFVGTIQTNVVGKQYLDNTQNETAVLKAYTTTNVNLQYNLPTKKWGEGKQGVPEVKLLCQINNIFNAKYASNGGSDCSYFQNGKACWPWYYAQAGINVHAGFVVQW